MAFIAAAVMTVPHIIGSKMQSDAANDAANKQTAASQDANSMQRQMFDQQQKSSQPYQQAGATALSQMADPYFQKTFGMSDFQQDPGYQFRMDQGSKALQASAAARGGLMGGNFATALNKYGQDYASNEYQNAYNRFNNDQSQRFGRLSQIAGMGANATGQMGQYGANYAGQYGNNVMGAANAQGTAGMTGAQSWADTLGGFGDMPLKVGAMALGAKKAGMFALGGVVPDETEQTLGEAIGYPGSKKSKPHAADGGVVPQGPSLDPDKVKQFMQGSIFNPQGKKMAEGGMIPGPEMVRGNSLANDVVPIMASGGEVILPKTVAQKKSVQDFLLKYPEMRKAAPGMLSLADLANMKRGRK